MARASIITKKGTQKVLKSTRKYEQVEKITKAGAIIQLLHRLISTEAQGYRSSLSLQWDCGGAPTVDSGTEGSKYKGSQLFVHAPSRQ